MLGHAGDIFFILNTPIHWLWVPVMAYGFCTLPWYTVLLTHALDVIVGSLLGVFRLRHNLGLMLELLVAYVAMISGVVWYFFLR